MRANGEGGKVCAHCYGADCANKQRRMGKGLGCECKSRELCSRECVCVWSFEVRPDPARREEDCALGLGNDELLGCRGMRLSCLVVLVVQLLGHSHLRKCNGRQRVYAQQVASDVGQHI